MWFLLKQPSNDLCLCVSSSVFPYWTLSMYYLINSMLEWYTWCTINNANISMLYSHHTTIFTQRLWLISRLQTEGQTHRMWFTVLMHIAHFEKCHPMHAERCAQYTYYRTSMTSICPFPHALHLLSLSLSLSLSARLPRQAFLLPV